MEFKIPIGFGISATLVIGPDAITHKQGIRSRSWPLAEVTGFAVKRRKAMFGLAASELLFGVGGKTVRLPFAPDSDEGRRALAALAERIPAVEPDVLAPHGWRDRITEPRITIAILIAGAAAMTGATMPRFHDRAELFGYASVVVAAWIAAVILFVKGWRRSGPKR